VFTTQQVLERTEPILHVTHDSDDDGWQFLGCTDGTLENAKIIALHEAVELIPQFFCTSPICPLDGMLFVIPLRTLGNAKQWMMQPKPSNQSMANRSPQRYVFDVDLN
jgi:hypothetical protein